MFIQSILTIGAIAAGGLRPMYLLLLVLAILLILAGCSIALVTLRNQRKGQLALVTQKPLESEPF